MTGLYITEKESMTRPLLIFSNLSMSWRQSYYQQQSLLCLDLNHIISSNLYYVLTSIILQDPTIYCTTAVESLAHAVDNTYKLCCPIKSKTLSNKDWKMFWISREIISNIKKIQHYFALYCQNKTPKDFWNSFLKFCHRAN